MHPHLIWHRLFVCFAVWFVGCEPAETSVAVAPPQVHSAEQPAQDEQETRSVDDDAPRLSASAVQDLKTRVGETIVVTGDIERVGKSSGGHCFLNFVGNGELTVFIASDDVANFEPAPETAYDGKTIAVRGTLERYQGKLQIRVRAPEAITLVEKARGPPDADQPLEPVTLKAAGRDAWISPACLTYTGRDPQGLTRRDHVLRHAEDLPARDGPHGVFDGGEDLTFAWIDAAWNKIRRDVLPAVVEGDRATYTVSMGRRVGYLGGRTGAERGNPPLTRIFLVLRKGTTEVITAFPK